MLLVAQSSTTLPLTATAMAFSVQFAVIVTCSTIPAISTARLLAPHPTSVPHTRVSAANSAPQT
eukprot:2063281-Rhodomonas_salina.2